MSGKVTVNDVELDWLAREVLFSIEASGGESNTSEIRELTGKHAEKVKYRFEKLERAELVNRGDPEQLSDGRMGPTPVRITEQGKEIVDEGFDVEETVEERFRKIERRIERYEDIREELYQLRDENEELRERVDDLEQKVEQLVEWTTPELETQR